MIRRLLRIVLYIGCFLASYLIVMFVLSRIPVNTNDSDPKQEITIYIKSNGVHTDIVVPIKSEVTDWNTMIQPAGSVQDYDQMTYVAFGWGDRDFYLNTPEWSDLKVTTALNAAFFMGTGLMHVTYYRQLQPGERCVKVFISKDEYKDLVQFISGTFLTASDGSAKLIPNAAYGNHDCFYLATGKYNLFYTCNSWANNALKAGNQKAALWTLTDTGILNHYRQ